MKKLAWNSTLKKTKTVASGPITSWQIEGKNVEAMTDFIFLGSKITVDTDCSHEIKRYFLLGRKTMANLNRILKSRGNTLPTKVYTVKAMLVVQMVKNLLAMLETWVWSLSWEDPMEEVWQSVLIAHVMISFAVLPDCHSRYLIFCVWWYLIVS